MNIEPNGTDRWNTVTEKCKIKTFSSSNKIAILELCLIFLPVGHLIKEPP